MSSDFFPLYLSNIVAINTAVLRDWSSAGALLCCAQDKCKPSFSEACRRDGKRYSKRVENREKKAKNKMIGGNNNNNEQAIIINVTSPDTLHKRHSSGQELSLSLLTCPKDGTLLAMPQRNF